MSPLQIQQKLMYRSRLLRDVAMRFSMAVLSDDYAEASKCQTEAHELRVEILRLKREYQDAVSLRVEQAAAIEAAERILAEAQDDRQHR
jgi:hypothetical protein